MALTNETAVKINNALPDLQAAQLGTEVKTDQTNIAANASAIANILTGVGFNLPTSDPGVAGRLWSNSGVVNVSDGT